VPLQNAIGRDSISGFHAHKIAGRQLDGFDLNPGSVALYPHTRRGQAPQVSESGLGLPLLPHYRAWRSEENCCDGERFERPAPRPFMPPRRQIHSQGEQQNIR
jgi:hypothetical protein